MPSNNLSTPNGAPPDDDKGGWSDIFWRFILKLQNHSGNMLWVPLIASMMTFSANLLLDIADDGTIDESEFHNLVHGASSAEMIVLAIVMALLKIKR